MAVDSESGLDGLPLLRAEFEEKMQEVRRSALWTWIAKLRVRPSMGVLKPSFLDRSTPTKPPHPTSWLDGLRGYAAFCVFIYHFQHVFHRTFYFGFGSKDSDGNYTNYWLIQLPIIRLIFNGGPMVSVFWVLSGVSLSLKPIQLARNQAWDKFFDTLFSSVFRRALRLYLPVFAVQICVLLATLLGFYDYADEVQKNYHWAGTNETQHEVLETKTAQIADWALTMWKFINPFAPMRPKYDIHLWTIPLEFRNSIILFATLVGYAKLKPRIRIFLTLVLYLYLVVIDQGDVALFIAGMACAEYLVIRDEDTKRLPSAEKTQPDEQSLGTKAIWTFVYLVGLHLLSIPAWNYQHSLGYETLCNLTPSFIANLEITWQRVGAAIMLLGLCGGNYLRKPFSSPLALYLGKISFPLYITHGPVTHALGYRLVPFFWSIFGDTSLFQYELAVVLAFIITAVVVIFLADILMRTIDTPSVRLGRTLQTRWSM